VEVAKARGYRSVKTKSELEELGFTKAQRRVPALLIPVSDVRGEIATYQIRPDVPRINKRGKPVKYETPSDSKMVLDIPPNARPSLGNPAIPLFITEGARKADSGISIEICCIDVLGVWNFRGSNELGGKVALPDWEYIALKERVAYLVFDSDVMMKEEVYKALIRLKAFLEYRGAQVRLIYLPTGPAAKKQGLDDFLAAGHTKDDLLYLATETILYPPSNDSGKDTPYAARDGRIYWLKETEYGVSAVQLANFVARIAGELSVDDGLEEQRQFEITVEIDGHSKSVVIPAQEFGGMNWVTQHLGAGAVISAGFGIRDRAREAIQSLSMDIDQRIVFTHIGWRQVGGVWVYLHAGGAIGSNGALPGIGK
jgi:hypothetical protein